MYNDLIFLSQSISKYVVGMEGNISKKNNTGLTIKASGSKLKEVEGKDFVNYNFNGEQLDNFERKGSMELGFHTHILSNYEVNYISHTHPVCTLKILISDEIKNFAEKRFFPDQVVFNGKKSCIVPYSKPGDELTNAVKNSLKDFIKKEKFFPKLILLQNHGIIACGKTIDECTIITEICEKSAEIFLTQYNKNSLSEKEIDELINDKNEIYRLNNL